MNWAKLQLCASPCARSQICGEGEYQVWSVGLKLGMHTNPMDLNVTMPGLGYQKDIRDNLPSKQWEIEITHLQLNHVPKMDGETSD